MNDYLLLFKTKPLNGPPAITVLFGPANTKPVINSDQPVLIYPTREFKNKYGIPEAGVNVTLFLSRMPVTSRIKEFTVNPEL